MLKIIHLAHSCFLIVNGKEKLIVDPCGDSFGRLIRETVNYVLISHDHYDHNDTEHIKLEPNTSSIKFNTVSSYHDDQNGNLRGKNSIHIIETENTRVCHLGDLGHILTEEQIKLIGTVDVLLIPVGGIYTIDYKQAIEVVKQLNPSAVIPMHYQTDNWGVNKGVDRVENFIENIHGYEIIKSDTNELLYTKSNEHIMYLI